MIAHRDCYTLTCDGCGTDFEFEGFVPHFDSELDALDWFRNAGGEVEGDRHLCEDCVLARNEGSTP